MYCNKNSTFFTKFKIQISLSLLSPCGAAVICILLLALMSKKAICFLVVLNNYVIKMMQRVLLYNDRYY